MKALTLTIFILIQSLHYNCNGQVVIERKWHHQIYNDIFVMKGNDTTNLTKFQPWENIVDFEVSLDSSYCFVRHKPNKPNTPYLLTLYNLKTFQKIKEIIPGYGGDFKWTNNSQIIHSWGCGTNCANVRLYDLQLKEIFYTLSSGGFKYSPEKNFLVQLSMHGDKIWVFDLRSLKTNTIPKAFTTKIEMDYNWDDFQFSTEFEIIISNADRSIVLKRIDLNNVVWTNIDPKEIGEFYER